MIIIIKNFNLLETLGCNKDLKNFQYRLFEFIHWKKDLKFVEK